MFSISMSACSSVFSVKLEDEHAQHEGHDGDNRNEIGIRRGMIPVSSSRSARKEKA